MPLPEDREHLIGLRGAHAAARTDAATCLQALVTAQGELRRLARTRTPDDPDLVAAEAEASQANDALAAARAGERAARDGVATGLAAWLANFPATDLEEAGQLDRRYPVALLPVRLVTRFLPVAAATELRVRIYPDVLVADIHERGLTAAERAAGLAYWARDAGWDPAREEGAWRALVARYPPPRAAWIVRETTPTNLADRPSGTPDVPTTDERPASTTRAAEARVLPDRWMVVAYRDGAERHRVLGAPVVDPLALSPDPAEDDPGRLINVSGDGLELDPEVAWLVDYQRAEQAGMAVTIPKLTKADRAGGFDRVLALGLKASLTEVEGADRLAALLEGHHYGRGLAFVGQGTPTNNIPDRPSTYPPVDPGGAASFALERSERSVPDWADGPRAASALGVRERLARELPHLAGADAQEARAARLMNDALWPATWGYYLEQLLDPALTPKLLDATRDWFTTHVHGRGPYAAFRVGGMPYGLLPVSSLGRWESPVGAAGLEAALPGILRALRPAWAARAPEASRVGRSADSDGDLLDVLSMEARPREVRLRAATGSDFIFNLVQFFGLDAVGLTASGWDAWRQRQEEVAQAARARLAAFGWPGDMRDPRIARITYADAAHRFRFPLVAAGPSSEDVRLGTLAGIPAPARTYLEWIRNSPIDELRQQRAEEPPLLYLLLRHGMLLEYAHAALDMLEVAPDERREPELVGIALGPSNAPHRTIWDAFDTPDPATGTPIKDLLITGAHRAAEPTVRYRERLAEIERIPTAELERLLTETLGTCSDRLDAWITSLSAQRLQTMRESELDGCHLGGYGWVERLRPVKAGEVQVRQLDDGRTVFVQQPSGGYVQAPSLAHAATAAVLRNGYLSRAAETDRPFAIDLSSARVRGARALLDGVRSGQPLGGLLGYHLERALHEGRLEKYIAPLRSRFPLVAGKDDAPRTPGDEPVESTSARTVVDGLSMWRRRQAGSSPFQGLADPITGAPAPPGELAALDAILAAAGEALDGVSDLLMAESVYQMVRGDAAAAGAGLDALADGARPPDPEIARSPRGGTALTHRVLVVLGGPLPPAPAGWSSQTPRSVTEPHLDRWAGALLGDPKATARVTYPAPTASDPTARAEVKITFTELGLCPLDVIALAGDAAATAEQASELDRRVARAALAKLPVGARSGDLRITYAPDPTAEPGAARSFADVVEVARSLSAVIGSARPLRPVDLLPPAKAAGAGGADLLEDEARRRADAARRAMVAAHDTLAGGVRALAADLVARDDALREGRPLPAPPDLVRLEEALVSAAPFGSPGAFPAPGVSAEELLSRGRSVFADMARRLEAATGDPANVVEAVFGRSFPFLARFIPAPDGADELDRALGYAELIGGPPNPTRAWLAQAATVRPALSRWRRLELYATAIGTGGRPLDVAQLPHLDGAPWAALPFSPGSGPPPDGRVSLVMHRFAAPTATEPWVGLQLDEWTEVIPAADEQTGVAFHYDDAGSEPPQAVLLAVPPVPGGGPWDSATLVDILNETIEAAAMRAVDAELIGEVGQLLPALYVAANSAGSAVGSIGDAIGVDFGADYLRTGDYP